jgi:hypothetical protein
MAVTLNDVLKGQKDPFAVGFIKNLLRQSDLLKIIPLQTVDSLEVEGARWQTLPSTGTRKVGGTYTEASGATETVKETLFIYGGDITIDRVLSKVKSKFQDELTNQVAMKSQSLSSVINDYFINGDHSVAAYGDGFEGLKKRISNLPARMTIDLGSDSLKVLASTANENTFVDAVHEAIKKVGGGQNQNLKGGFKGAIFCNETTYLGMGKVLRRLGLLNQNTDSFDRVFDSFQGFALIDVGFKNDQSTEIITDTEDPGDAGNDASSLYVVRFGEDDGLHMIQLAGTSPAPYDPVKAGEGGASGPAFMRRIDWAIGLRAFGSYYAARVNGFKMAAS